MKNTSKIQQSQATVAKSGQSYPNQPYHQKFSVFYGWWMLIGNLIVAAACLIAPITFFISQTTAASRPGHYGSGLILYPIIGIALLLLLVAIYFIKRGRLILRRQASLASLRHASSLMLLLGILIAAVGAWFNLVVLHGISDITTSIALGFTALYYGLSVLVAFIYKVGYQGLH